MINRFSKSAEPIKDIRDYIIADQFIEVAKQKLFDQWSSEVKEFIGDNFVFKIDEHVPKKIVKFFNRSFDKNMIKKCVRGNCFNLIKTLHLRFDNPWIRSNLCKMSSYYGNELILKWAMQKSYIRFDHIKIIECTCQEGHVNILFFLKRKQIKNS